MELSYRCFQLQKGDWAIQNQVCLLLQEWGRVCASFFFVIPTLKDLYLIYPYLIRNEIGTTLELYNKHVSMLWYWRVLYCRDFESFHSKTMAIVWGATMSLDYFISLYWIFSGLSHLLIFPSGRIRKENLGRIHLTH